MQLLASRGRSHPEHARPQQPFEPEDDSAGEREDLGEDFGREPGVEQAGGQPWFGAEGEPGYYKLGFQFDAGRFGLPRERFVEALQAEGIAFDVGFRGLHAGRSAKRFRRGGDLAEADRAHSGAVILHHPVLLGEAGAVAEVAAAVLKVYRWARASKGDDRA